MSDNKAENGMPEGDGGRYRRETEKVRARERRGLAVRPGGPV